ncbi:MAG: hypothetical protein BMS9Abin20_1222 [Acidimicrobiia bacterium]|nr:MAG: hypothetical protein BMS9Abin20_1222 [Acidimicrobiia bacterium]
MKGHSCGVKCVRLDIASTARINLHTRTSDWLSVAMVNDAFGSESMVGSQNALRRSNIYRSRPNGYTVDMTKRLVDIDDELIAEARRLTGAATMKETVNTALQELIDTELRRRHLRRLETGEGTDLADDETMRAAWG